MVPDPPVVITGSYSPSTPSSPAAAGGSYSPSTPASPAAPGASYSASAPAGPAGASSAFTGSGKVIHLDYDQTDDMPAGRFVLLGTSAELGDVWVYEADAGGVTITQAGGLSGGGTVWVQRDNGGYAWSMEHSSDWANVSPSVYLQQTAVDTSRTINPTPASVPRGGWLDVPNDVDPEDGGMFALTLRASGSPAAAGSSYSPSTPAAPPAIS